MVTLVDQIGQSHTFTTIPKRIVSLVPSLTELLVDLGLRDNIKGVTKFCVYPQNIKEEKTIVGGTKQVYVEKIAALNPDIILCNKEENTKEIVQSLSKIAPVHVSDIKSLEDTYLLIKQYGLLFDAHKLAQKLVEDIQEKAAALKESLAGSYRKSCLYVIWRNPYMVAGQDTFINHILDLNNFNNTCLDKRYPEIEIEDMFDVDYILLSSEPYPFKESHRKTLEKHTRGKVILVDGAYFSWYGSRLIDAFNYFKQLNEFL